MTIKWTFKFSNNDNNNDDDNHNHFHYNNNDNDNDNKEPILVLGLDATLIFYREARHSSTNNSSGSEKN